MQTAVRKTIAPEKISHAAAKVSNEALLEECLKLVAAWDKFPVRDLANKDPRVRRALESLQIDTCCYGGIKLKEGAEAAKVRQDKLCEAVKKAFMETEIPKENDSVWMKRSDRDLIHYIVTNYHKKLKEDMPLFESYFVKVIKAHELHAKELKQLFAVYKAFMTEMTAHLKKEEEILFPSLLAGGIPVMEQKRLIREMETEHASAGNYLKEMKAITFNYRIPEYACPTMRTLYEGLRDMAPIMREHIYLENNILFPRAIITEL